MKKIIPIAVIAMFGLLSVTSCKKSSSSGYTCTCTYKASAGASTTTQKYPLPSGTSQTTATDTCATFQTAFQLVDSTAKCTL